MTNISRALKNALVSCIDSKILFLLFVPLLLALAIGILLFVSVGTIWIASLSDYMQHSAAAGYLNGTWISSDAIGMATSLTAAVLVVLLIFPVAYVLAVILVSILLMPMILRILERSHYPGLLKKRGGSAVGNVWNTLKSSLIYAVLLILTLPLWLIPGGAVLVPIFLGAYLNKRVFVYDVLEEYASAEERRIIESKHRQSLYGLGAILGSLNYVPLTFVVMPVFAGLSYAHFCLNALKELRDNGPT